MPTCFVVMGFGKKTDYPTGRVLDLDKSYKYIIKPASEAAGYQCIRADEIQHSGNINVPMYQQLLNADVVIADVSTYNPNAFYELGVRHALKPYTTITIAEDKLVFPFDVGQIAIRTYHHLGEGIDFGEVERMRKELQDAIKAVGAQAACDSPVYTFLQGLNPPALAKKEVERALAAAGPEAEAASAPTIRTLMDQADAAFARRDFVTAKSLLSVVRTMMPKDAYVAQRLALATYKSKLPTPEDALKEAAGILESLEPAMSTDAETLGLYGAVHKGFWDATNAEAHLEKAIWAHEKGFYVRNDYYNGINLAFLLNVRASLRAETDPAEAIADFVLARRTRRRVLALCQALMEGTPKPTGADEYWVKATMAEAYAGLGDEAKALQTLSEAKALPAALEWMKQSTDDQLARLRELLAKSPLGRIAAPRP
ncbi:MAG TPA: TRAFs-binding domain-containing protein [Verrucomicrobiae bacterium]|nr:TRAFs-binding domain-containing protein [Verrucomicrobiae bacterium]